MPFENDPLGTIDIVLNVVLFAPFGFLLMLAGSAARSAER